MGIVEIGILLCLIALLVVGLRRPAQTLGRSALATARGHLSTIFAVAALLVLSAFVLQSGSWAAMVLLLLMAFAILWFREFRFLMQLDDEAFPGRFDKPIWAFLLIALPPIGVLTFYSFRKAHWPEPKPVDVGYARDMS